jgi:hypothetical protein
VSEKNLVGPAVAACRTLSEVLADDETPAFNVALRDEAVEEDEVEPISEPMEEEVQFVAPDSMGAWIPFELHHSILHGLCEAGFLNPTPIQVRPLHVTPC